MSAWPTYKVHGKYEVKPPAPPRAWSVMHHADLGLPPDPPLGVKPDDGSWIVPLVVGVVTGLAFLMAVAVSS